MDLHLRGCQGLGFRLLEFRVDLGFYGFSGFRILGLVGCRVYLGACGFRVWG